MSIWIGGGSGGGGGGAAVVTHTLASTPGFGIVPEATLADIAARDAYTPTGNGWVEVTVSDHGNADARLYHWNGNVSAWVGPFPTSLKNAPYVLGQNGESVLYVPSGLEPANGSPDGPTYDAVGVADLSMQAAVNRTCRLVLLQASDPGAIPAGGRASIVNLSSDSNAVGLIVGRGANRIYEPISQALAISDRVAMMGRHAVADFILDEFGAVQMAGYDAGSIYGTASPFQPSEFLVGGRPMLLQTDRSGALTYWDSSDLSLQDLYNVDTAGQADGKVLRYVDSSGKWTAMEPAGVATEWNPLDASSRVAAPSFVTPAAMAVPSMSRAIRLQDGAANGGIRARTPRSAGRYFWEIVWKTSSGGSVMMPGIARSNYTISSSATSTEVALYYGITGLILQNGTQVSGLDTIAVGDVVGIQVDLDARTIQWFKNNVALNAAPYDYGALMSAGPVCPAIWHDQGSASESLANFSRNDWVYGPTDASFGVWER